MSTKLIVVIEGVSLVLYSEMEIKCYARNLFIWIMVEVILVVSSLYYRYIFRLDVTRTTESDIKNEKFYEHPVSHSDYRSKIFKECFYLSSNARIKSESVERKKVRESNQSQCKRLITLEKYKGRTGNQMFEIASLLGIAFTYDLLPVIPQGTRLSKYFDLPNIFTNSTLQHATIYECRTWAKVCNFSAQMKTEKGNATLKGYFQSWKYFYNIRNIIKLVFKFKDIHLRNAKNYLTSVSIKGFRRVCFHIRLLPKDSIEYVLPDFYLTFYEKVRWFYLSNFKLVQFIIVSNNKQWCKEHFHNVNITQFPNPGDDLALLSICDHVVVTLGTFGWWGAWLSGGRTVYFDRVLKEGSRLNFNIKKEDYYPPSWIGIG